MKQLLFGNVEVDQQIPPMKINLDVIDLVKYSAATWNFYLLHIEKDYAQKKGFKDINMHAPFYGAVISSMLTRWTGDPGALRKQNYAVKKMAYPGDTLRISGKVIEKCIISEENQVRCDTWVENQDDIKIASGSALIALPVKGF